MPRTRPPADELARLGFLMRRWRDERDHTQLEAARAAGISTATWGGLERTPRHTPDERTLRTIARTIGISPADALRAGGYRPELGDVVAGLVADFDAAITSCDELCDFLRARRDELAELLDAG